MKTSWVKMELFIFSFKEILCVSHFNKMELVSHLKHCSPLLPGAKVLLGSEMTPQCTEWSWLLSHMCVDHGKRLKGLLSSMYLFLQKTI